MPLPAGLSVTDAACLPTAWLTAWRMLTTKGRVAEADAVLVQGAGGGVATAAVVLAVALGKRVYATSRDAAKRERIAELGATALEPGARLPERVDVVIETVGAATFDHSLKSAAPMARIVVSGATAGHEPTVNLRRVFAMQLEILGTSMGTPDELAELLAFCAEHGVRPVVDSVVAVQPGRGRRSPGCTPATSSARSSSTTPPEARRAVRPAASCGRGGRSGRGLRVVPEPPGQAGARRSEAVVEGGEVAAGRRRWGGGSLAAGSP